MQKKADYIIIGAGGSGIKPRLLPDEKGKRCDRTGTR